MPPMREKLAAVADLIRLDRQYGTLLLLAPTLWSLVIASSGRPSPFHLIVFIAGTFLMRSAGCVVNDLADRDFDRHVERTKGRPLADGRLTPTEALAVFTALILPAFGLVLLLNRITILLSVAGLVIAVAYPFTKRFTHLPQFVMGVAFSWGSLMAWTAARGRMEAPAILIFLANLSWAASYDTVYALMDRDDDARIGVKSTALLFGEKTWLAVAILLVASTAALAGLGWVAGLGRVYYVSLAIVVALFADQVIRIRGTADRAALFSTFKANVRIGFVILIGIALDFWAMR